MGVSFFVCGASVLYAMNHYVSLNGSHVSPYSSWATAATNIQSAVDVAVSGDVVVVTDGVYIVGSTITVTNGITVQSENGSEVTEVNGDASVRCFNLIGPEIILKGFTVRQGYAPIAGGIYMSNGARVKNCVLLNNRAIGGPSVPGYNAYGGGIYLESGGEISNCSILSNRAEIGYGGGIYILGGGTVSNCAIRKNVADNGGNHPNGGFGGGVCSVSNGIIRQCVIVDNWAGSGGGVDCQDSWVEGCLIQSNIASYSYYNQSARGGGIRENNSLIENCLIAGNAGVKYGGGVYGSASGMLQNCTIVENRAQYGHGGGTADANLRNCIVWENLAYEGVTNCSGGTVLCTDTTPLRTGAGNISEDPAFAGSTSGNYRLAAGSPCIDTGSDTDAPNVDIEGTPRPLDGNDDGTAEFDMGAYEFVHSTADTDQDGLSDLDEIVQFGCNPIWSDTDDDGQNDGDEVVAGTDSLDHGSYFAMTADSVGADEVLISWNGCTDRIYDVYSCDSELGVDACFDPILSLTGIVFSVDGSTSVVNTISSDVDTRYYRVRVRMQ